MACKPSDGVFACQLFYSWEGVRFIFRISTLSFTYPYCLLESYMNIKSHFHELRWRGFYCLLAFLSCFLCAFLFAEEILFLLVKPLFAQGTGCHLIYTKVPEAFFTQLKVACFFSAVTTMPILGCQLFAFLVPGLHEYEAKTIFTFLVGSIFLFFIGAMFTYVVVLPVAWNFFMLMGTGETIGLTISLEARMEDYVSLFLSTVFAISLAFETPLVVVACYCAGFIGQEQLINHRRYAVMFSLIGAAILSPPDLLSQLFIAFPMVISYELIILGSFVFKRDS